MPGKHGPWERMPGIRRQQETEKLLARQRKHSAETAEETESQTVEVEEGTEERDVGQFNGEGQPPLMKK